jgi:uncharacterized membrane protein HdeD (DUF308 family)
MNPENVSFATVEWDGVARDILMSLSIVTLLLNVYFIVQGCIRRARGGDPSSYAKGAFITSTCMAVIVLFTITWMLARAFQTAVRIGPSNAVVSMLWSTISGYLTTVAGCIPAMGLGVVGGMAIGHKRSPVLPK